MVSLSPISRMVLDAVRCVECGAGHGQCSCHVMREIEAEQRRSLDRMRELLPEREFADLEARWREIDRRAAR